MRSVTLTPRQLLALDRELRRSCSDRDVQRRLELLDASTGTFTPDVISARRHHDLRRKEALSVLLRDTGIPQRTPAWYCARDEMITASDVALALDESKYDDVSTFFVKKCAPTRMDSMTSGFGKCAPLEWGVMLEPVANALYARRFGVQIHEFGLLRHPSIPYIGASPDGITEDGIMLEIKCPFRRKIDGTVPRQYELQIQAQLEVCGLDDCDYMECEFFEYANNAAYDKDGSAEEGFTSMGLEKCVVAQYNDGTYAYSPLCPSRQELDAWMKSGVQRPPDRWRYVGLRRMMVQRVVRDKAMIDDMLQRLRDVWAQVLRYRSDPESYLREIERNQAPPPPPDLKPYAFLDE